MGKMRRHVEQILEHRTKFHAMTFLGSFQIRDEGWTMPDNGVEINKTITGIAQTEGVFDVLPQHPEIITRVTDRFNAMRRHHVTRSSEPSNFHKRLFCLSDPLQRTVHQFSQPNVCTGYRLRAGFQSALSIDDLRNHGHTAGNFYAVQKPLSRLRIEYHIIVKVQEMRDSVLRQFTGLFHSRQKRRSTTRIS